MLKAGRGGGGLIGGTAGQSLHDDVSGRPGGAADLDHLAWLRQRGRPGRRRDRGEGGTGVGGSRRGAAHGVGGSLGPQSVRHQPTAG